MLEKSDEGKKWQKKQSEIRLFTSTSNEPRFAPLLDPDSSPKKWEANRSQMSRKSSRTDPYSPIFGHIKVLHFFNGFLGFKLISSIDNNI